MRPSPPGLASPPRRSRSPGVQLVTGKPSAYTVDQWTERTLPRVHWQTWEVFGVVVAGLSMRPTPDFATPAKQSPRPSPREELRQPRRRNYPTPSIAWLSPHQTCDSAGGSHLQRAPEEAAVLQPLCPTSLELLRTGQRRRLPLSDSATEDCESVEQHQEISFRLAQWHFVDHLADRPALSAPSRTDPTFAAG